MFSYHIETNEDEVLVKMFGDLDIDVTEVVEQEILPRLLPFQAIVFNFGSVPFVDSTGIGVLIHLVETLRQNHEEVRIHIKDTQPLVEEVFDMIQLKEILGEEVFI